MQHVLPLNRSLVTGGKNICDWYPATSNTLILFPSKNYNNPLLTTNHILNNWWSPSFTEITFGKSSLDVDSCKELDKFWLKKKKMMKSEMLTKCNVWYWK